MKVSVGSDRYRLDDKHPYAQAILALARAYVPDGGSTRSAAAVPERNDVKQLWRDLGDAHRAFLVQVSRHPAGVSQADLESSLGVTWQGLRGVHNGLARICERLEIEKPVRVVGYNATNRRYIMDPDVAATVRGIKQ